MVAYFITYNLRGQDSEREILVKAKNLKAAKKIIGEKHGYADGRMIQIQNVIHLITEG